MPEYVFDTRRGDTPRPTDCAFPAALPYPTGWFSVGFSQEWAPGTVQCQSFMGQDIVVYRTRTGSIRASSAYCPHLGAHLGAGGSVDGEYLVCPFHKFAFDTAGTCVRTPYGKPPKAHLEMRYCCERFGIIWVWHSPDRDHPRWKLPNLPGTECGSVHRQIDVVGHPQELMENSIDYGHINAVHHIELEDASPLEFTDTTYRVSLRLAKELPLLGRIKFPATVTGLGLGALHTTFELPRYGIRAVQWSTVTPIAPWKQRVRVAMSAEIDLLMHVPTPLARALSHRAAVALSHVMNWWAWKITHEDLPILNHKKHLPHPKLNDQDGPIGPFRQWARRFYQPTDAGAHQRGAAVAELPVEDRPRSA